MSEHISKIGIEYIRDDVKFTVDGEFQESYNIDNLFAIDEITLTKDMATHSVKFGRISVLFARAERYKALKKQQMEVEYANCDYEVREELKSIGEKVTEGIIRAAVISDDAYGINVSDYDEAANVVSVLKNILIAMKTKGDMLISIGAQLRAEMSMTGMRINIDEHNDNINSLKSTLKKRKEQV